MIGRLLRRRCDWSCVDCGGVLDDEQALFLLTRIDPHSHVERRLTDAERENVERKMDEGRNLRELGRFGFGFGSVCRDCQEAQPA
jgi:hypothetical protein